MAPGCFSAFWCCRQPPSPSDDAIVSPVLAPAGATQSSSGSPSDNGGIRNAPATETNRPGTSPSPGHVDIPVPASTQDPLPTSSAILRPALSDAQPMSQHDPEGSVDVSVLAHAEEVPAVSSTSPLPYRLDPAKAQEHIDRISRFRILVMGRANAGKTTILQRVCNTTDQPEIFNGKGEEVDATVVQGSLTRGEHNIEDELVFRSNPRFVFHDSCGFEAGSEQQFDMMKQFVMDRAKTSKLDKRIHAIWFCIPLNENHRMVTAAETKFFDNCDTGHVPVIVLATKADTLELEVFEWLEDQGLSVCDVEVAKLQKEIVKNNIVKLKDWLGKTVFPPHDYLSLTGMQREGAECTPLLTCTANALKEEGLQQLIISTQQSNLKLCMEFAVMKTLKDCMNKQHDKFPSEAVAFKISRWFPYNYYWESSHGMFCFDLSDYGLGSFGSGEGFGIDHHSGMVDDHLVPSISSPRQYLKVPTFSTSMQYSTQNIAKNGIGAILVFEYLYFLLQVKPGRDDLQKDLNFAVKKYESSGIQATVNKLIQEAFQNHGDNVEILCPILVNIAQENQLSKMLNKKG